MKKYIFTPFMKWFLIGLGLILTIRYIILPGLTTPNTFINILIVLLSALIGSILAKIIIENIKNQINKLK